MVLSIIDVIALIAVQYLIGKSQDIAAVAGVTIMAFVLVIHIIYEAILRQR